LRHGRAKRKRHKLQDSARIGVQARQDYAIAVTIITPQSSMAAAAFRGVYLNNAGLVVEAA
jgi:hypothetical protein